MKELHAVTAEKMSHNVGSGVMAGCSFSMTGEVLTVSHGSNGAADTVALCHLHQTEPM